MVSTELFVGMLQAFKPGPPYRLETVGHALPEDAEIVEAKMTSDGPRNCLLAIKSESFKEGQTIRQPMIQYTRLDQAWFTHQSKESGFVWVRRSTGDVELGYWDSERKRFQDPNTVGAQSLLALEYFNDVTHWAPMDLKPPFAGVEQ